MLKASLTRRRVGNIICIGLESLKRKVQAEERPRAVHPIETVLSCAASDVR
jgi:hypothetical protein